MIRKLVFVIKTISVIGWNTICYLFGRTTDNCIQSIAYSLTHNNPIYVKLFQSLSTNSYLFSQKQLDILRKYTENVPYMDVEIDTCFHDTLLYIWGTTYKTNGLFFEHCLGEGPFFSCGRRQRGFEPSLGNF